MAIDSSIALGVKPMQFESPVNQLSNVLQIQNAQQSNALNAVKLQQAQVAQDRQNKLYSLMAGLPGDATDEQRSAALKGAGFFDQADVIDKNAIARQTQQNEGYAKRAAALKDFASVSRDLATNVMTQPTIENANAALDRAAQYHKLLGFGDLDTTQERANLAQMTSPDQIKQWAAGHALLAEKLLPKNEGFNAGDRYVTQSVDPVTGIPTQTSSTVIGQSADNKATNANQIKLEGIRQGGENARQDKSLKQTMLLQGFTQDKPGAPLQLAPNLEAEAQMIAAGKMPPPSGMAATRPQTSALMARVQQINPDFDATSYDAKRNAAKAFATGQQGNAMRSFQVAGQHLDQLGQLVDALNNRDNQTLNKIGNAVQTWNGGPAVTNFDAAKDVVSKEVIKAIVGAGGGVAEREELAKSMASANSPAQLKGVIQQYRNLMSAQHDALLQQRRAAGLSDSTLPNYSENAPSPAAKTVVRTGTLNGRKVVQYSDGTTDYAD